MRASLAVALAVTCLSVFALASRAGPDQSVVVSSAPPIIPLLEITSPVGCNATPSDVYPMWIYSWRALDPGMAPDSVRFIYLDTQFFNGNYSTTEAYLRANPNAPEWSPWQPYAPPYSGATWMSPPSPDGHYVFAVHGKDRYGNVDADFSKLRNMRRILIAPREHGPRLLVTSTYFAAISTYVTSTPPVKIDLVNGTPVDFCWRADALTYCGSVQGYRYGWDIGNPDDESQWGMPFTAFIDPLVCLPPNSVRPDGVHVLSVEAVDHAGFKSRAQVQVTWHPAPNPPDAWTRIYGDQVDQTASAIKIEHTNNFVVIGSFNGTLSLGGALLVSGGGTDVYVAKFNQYGTHLWSRAAGGAGAQTGRAIAVDEAGNVFVTGDFQNTMSFGGAPLVSAGSRDVFLAAYSATGTHLWSKRFGDAGEQWARGVATDPDGNVVITGEVTIGAINFGGGSFRTGIFAAKFDGDGNHIWSKSFLATGGRGIAIMIDPNGDLTFTGGLVGTADFGDGPETSSGGADIFVTKLHGDGSHVWNRHAGDGELQAGYALCADENGGVVVSGPLFGEVDMGGGPLVSAGGADLLIAKYDAEGNHMWSHRFGDVTEQWGLAVAVRSRGDVFMTGYFGGTTDFGGTSLTSAGLFDAFLARFDTHGVLISAQQFGDALSQFGRGLAVDATDDLIVFGDFDGTVVIGGETFTTAGARDLFLARVDVEYPVAIDDPRAPESLALRSYPNPFNPGTTIAYEVPAAGVVTVAIFDVRGALVRMLANGPRTAGTHDTRWDGRNERGEPAPTGVYFARVSFRDEVASRKLVLLK